MSGIYIKGMEMPKNCLDCPCCDDMGGAYCRPLQKKLGLAFASLYKPDDCPLIEVPKHGDLIDRDMVLEKAWDVETFVDAVRFAPTIIESEGDG